MLHLHLEFWSEGYFQYIKRSLFFPCAFRIENRDRERDRVFGREFWAWPGNSSASVAVPVWGRLGLSQMSLRGKTQPIACGTTRPPSLPCTETHHRCISSLFWKETTKQIYSFLCLSLKQADRDSWIFIKNELKSAYGNFVSILSQASKYLCFRDRFK